MHAPAEPILKLECFARGWFDNPALQKWQTKWSVGRRWSVACGVECMVAVANAVLYKIAIGFDFASLSLVVTEENDRSGQWP